MFRIDRQLVKVAQPADIPVIPIKLPPAKPPVDELKTITQAVAAANAQAATATRADADAKAIAEAQAMAQLQAMAEEQAAAQAQAIAQAQAMAEAKAEAAALAIAEVKTQCEKMLQEAQNAAGEILNDAHHAAAELVSDTRQQAELKAAAVLQEAAHQAEAKLRQAELEAQQQAVAIHDAARQEGNREGYEEGRRHGYEEGESKALEDHMEQNRAARQQISDLLAEMAAARDTFYNSFEGEIIDLALAMAAKITHTVIQKDDTAINSIIIHALKQMRRQGKITIRLNEEQYNTFFNAESANFALGDETISAAIISDPALEEGDMLLEAEGETVNAGWDSQLKYIEIAFQRSKALT